MSAGQSAAWLLLGVGAGVLVAAAWSHWMKGPNWSLFLGVGVTLIVVAVGVLLLRGLQQKKN